MILYARYHHICCWVLAAKNEGVPFVSFHRALLLSLVSLRWWETSANEIRNMLYRSVYFSYDSAFAFSHNVQKLIHAGMHLLAKKADDTQTDVIVPIFSFAGLENQ